MKCAWIFAAIFILSLRQVAGQPETVSIFRAIDVFVDSGNQALAAYQLTFVGADGVKIVGIEGGEHSAFAEPPYYDSGAMQNERVVIGAFNTTRDLPSGRVRVATIHVRTQNNVTAAYRVEVDAAAGSDGKAILVKATLEERTAR